MANTLIEAAEVDAVVVEQLTKYHSGDVDFTLSAVAYHLQQCVEKSLKAVLEYCGLDYRAMGHSIGKLAKSVENHCEDLLTNEQIDFLEEYNLVITNWEVSGRYPSDYVFSIKNLTKYITKVLDIFNTCKNYIEQSEDSENNSISKMNLK